MFVPFKDFEELQVICQDADSVIATIYTSLKDVLSLKNHLNFTAAYFIQDYEALFSPEGTSAYNSAVESYSLAKSHRVLCFAKTQWIVDQLKINHELHVNLVTPSFNQEQYARGYCKKNRKVLRIAGMVRTSTARRSPLMTLKVLGKIKAEFGKSVHITIFGSSREELRRLENVESISHSKCFDENKEKLGTDEIAKLMDDTDIFVDLSVYQAFGRSAAECMASHCIPIVPKVGGAVELVNGGGGVAVDTTNMAHIMAALRELISLPETQRRLMTIRALTKVTFMSNERAAMDVLNLLLQDALRST